MSKIPEFESALTLYNTIYISELFNDEQDGHKTKGYLKEHKYKKHEG